MRSRVPGPCDLRRSSESACRYFAKDAAPVVAFTFTVLVGELVRVNGGNEMLHVIAGVRGFLAVCGT